MLQTIRRLWHQFFRRSGTIENEPINKVSLLFILLIDLFIITNVFAGLKDISQWHLSPAQTYPCYANWEAYRADKAADKDYKLVRAPIVTNPNLPPSQSTISQTYRQAEVGHLGKVSTTCLQYAESEDKINNSANQQQAKAIEAKQKQISQLEKANQKIRTQYDSSLLEKIAGQDPSQSINAVGAEKAKQELEANTRAIDQLKQETATLKNQLVARPESASFLAFLKDNEKFSAVQKGHEQASFWHSSLQFALQSLFLIPLIVVALSVHIFAQRKRYGLMALMSWHLVAIFCIPLVLKFFEFLQLGSIFKFLFHIISTLFGGLLFLISYLYIVLIPLLGFGIIKFFQKIVFNPKSQAASRAQSSRCLKCAKKIHHNDAYCPHCGYHQYIECQNCHDLTYKHLPHCKHCGTPQVSEIG
jgi:predicted RNA-binding Zn-ribbon protein involved in translation (DUF1610 family)